MTSLFPDLQPRDWSDDPLHQTLGQLRDIQSKVDEGTSLALHNWAVFHWSTRFKLESADYHAKVLRHIHRASLNDEEDAVHYRLRHWQFGELFFQLSGAFDTLLQEINVLNMMGLDSENVDWETLSKKTKERQFRSLKTVRFLKRHWDDRWLVEIRMFRNASAHRNYIPFVSTKGLVGHPPPWGRFECHIIWRGLKNDKVVEAHKDDARQLPQVCEDYYASAFGTITECWRLMSEKWPKALNKGASP